MKVLWQHHGKEEATWKPEATMRVQYPQLFSLGNNFEDETLLKGGGGERENFNTLKYTLIVL